MEKQPVYRLKKPLGAEDMQFVAPGPSKQEWMGPTAELQIYVGNDHTIRIVVPLVTLESCPEYFEEIEGDTIEE